MIDYNKNKQFIVVSLIVTVGIKVNTSLYPNMPASLVYGPAVPAADTAAPTPLSEELDSV